MKIKNIFSILVAACALAACDVIPEGERIEEVETEAKRVVLLQEFTGQQCVNCPEAAKIATGLLEAYPENVVVVALHAKGHGFVPSWSGDLGLPKDEAMEYLRFYGGDATTGLPSGVINGIQFEGKYIQDRSTWTAQVASQMELEPDCVMDMEHSVDGKKHTVTVKLDPSDKLDYNVSLILWLIESGMIGQQSSQTEGTIKDYVHNHAFRECLNGLWGEELQIVSAPISHSCTFEISESYVADNCSVVAVLVNTETKAVVQAAEIALGAGAGH